MDKITNTLPNGTERFLNGRSVFILPSGIKHRFDGPAVICDNGDKEWWFNGVRHRYDGPALIANNGAHKSWYYQGKLHRRGGPASINKDCITWYRYGRRHRDDGPAVEYINDRKKSCFFIHDIELTVNDYIKNTTMLSEEEKLMLKLKYG